jgi:hypothetical protein
MYELANVCEVHVSDLATVMQFVSNMFDNFHVEEGKCVTAVIRSSPSNER